MAESAWPDQALTMTASNEDMNSSPRTSILDLAERRLAWLGQRQTLLAQNIANVDTPGYRARDLAPFATALNAATGLTASRTSPLHMTGTEGGSSLGAVPPLERRIDGNAVQLESELSKVAQTDSDQAMTTDLYKKYLSLYRTALGR